MRLYHKDGVHLNLSGSYKLAENIGITCKTKTPSQSNTQQKRQVPKRRHTNANMDLTYSVTVAMSMVTRLKCVRYTRYMAMVIVL
jgi:hypothetical protein